MFNLFTRNIPGDKPFYITTTLPYVNAKPHIGHIMELVKADALARYRRINSQIIHGKELNSDYDENVFFNTGTDEHGLKIYQKAEEVNIDVKDFVDEQQKNIRNLKEILSISFDKFIRTTDEEHVKAAQIFWTKCLEAGYIYKKNYSGLYCVGCEAFVKEKDLLNGECEDHPGKKPTEISEENYFFKYSAFSKDLLEKYQNSQKEKRSFVIPASRLNEAIKLVENGLEDFSISRLKSKMPWGIQVPGDDEHVMYVWFDALINYISTLGWPDDADGKYKKFWENGETVQICGKDNLQFQATRWQSMLLSVGLPTTDHLIVNGFVTNDGKKMSKTVGNVVDPIKYVEEYGPEAVRYYVIRELHPFEDSDFSDKKFIDSYNANLANGLGNVVSRVLQMAAMNDINIDVETLIKQIKKTWLKQKTYHKAMAEFNMQKAMDEVWQQIAKIDTIISETEPFKLIKENPKKAKEIIKDLLIKVWEVSVLVEPFLPRTSRKIKEAIKTGQKPEPLFVRK